MYSFIQVYNTLTGDGHSPFNTTNMKEKPTVLRLKDYDYILKVENLSPSNMKSINTFINNKFRWHLDVDDDSISPLYVNDKEGNPVFGEHGTIDNGGKVVMYDEPSFMGSSSVFYNKKTISRLPTKLLYGFSKNIISVNEFKEYQKYKNPGGWYFCQFITYCIKITNNKKIDVVDALVWGFSYVDEKLDTFEYDCNGNSNLNAPLIFKNIINQWNKTKRVSIKINKIYLITSNINKILLKFITDIKISNKPKNFVFNLRNTKPQFVKIKK